MTRECQVRFWEGLRVKFSGPTRSDPIYFRSVLKMSVSASSLPIEAVHEIQPQTPLPLPNPQQ